MVYSAGPGDMSCTPFPVSGHRHLPFGSFAFLDCLLPVDATAAGQVGWCVHRADRTVDLSSRVRGALWRLPGPASDEPVSTAQRFLHQRY